MQQVGTKEYRTRHDWVGKVIHCELCKRLYFDHVDKWYMHKLESFLGNEMHKVLRDLEIQTDHPIPARKKKSLILIIKKKRTCHFVDFAVLAHQRVNMKESKIIGKYLDFAREQKTQLNMKVTVIPIVVERSQVERSQGLGKESWGTRD